MWQLLAIPFLTIFFQSQGTVITKVAGENTLLTIQCATGIVIQSANFGRLSKTVCTGTYATGSAQLNSVSCSSPNSLSIVNSRCNGYTSCSVNASSTVFGGDPCSGIYKYLTVTYDCPVTPTSTSTTTTSVSTTTSTSTAVPTSTVVLSTSTSTVTVPTSTSTTTFSTSTISLPTSTSTTSTTVPTSTSTTTVQTSTSTETLSTTVTVPMASSSDSSALPSTVESTTTSIVPSAMATTPITINGVINITTAVVQLKCTQNPCLNGADCTLSVGGSSNVTTCKCVGNWKGQICDVFGFPVDAAGVATMVISTLNCGSVVGLLSVVVATHLVVHDMQTQSILILNGDVAILAAHILILTCRVPYLMDLSPLQCRCVASAIQFLVVAHFFFLFLESLQSYCITTFVISRGSFVAGRVQLVLFGWAVPLIMTGVTVAVRFAEFNLPWSCVVNYGQPVHLALWLPIVVFGWGAIIITEAAGGDSRGNKMLLNTSKPEYTSGQIGLASITLITVLSYLAFGLMSFAIYSLNVYLTSAAMIANICFAVVLFFFHSLSIAKNRRLILKMWRKIRSSSNSRVSNNNRILSNTQ